MSAEPRRTRLYVFPGGMLETTDYGDGDSGGIYLEFGNSELPQRVSGASEVPAPRCPVEPADADMCRRVLGSLRAL